jgi:hypothetical protein
MYKSHHAWAVSMKEDPIYLGERGWSWLGCCSLWFRYLFRSSLKLYKLPCNCHNFPPIGQVRMTFTPSFESMYEGRSYIYGRVGLVLVGLLRPLVLLFEYLIGSSLELYKLLCNGQNFHLIGKVAYTNHTMLENYLWRKILYTWESRAGLGWVVAASGSVICPDLH